MDALQFDHIPEMRQPYLLLTFEGWSNAAGVATAAGECLIEHLQAEYFASIDPEEFYSFTDQRPQARYNEEGDRDIIWPSNDFYVALRPELEHDVIICVGVEPHLKWRTFTNLMVDFIKRCNVYQTITLGALWADVLYSAPVPFSGSSTDLTLSNRLGLKSSGSRYEGPTGMVGVLHDILRRNELTSASLWANMPYYVSATPNPKGILALGQRSMEIVGLPSNFPDLESEAKEFDSRVAEAIATDPKVSSHVKELERRAEQQQIKNQSLIPENSASGEDLAAEFERFLREQREEPNEN